MKFEEVYDLLATYQRERCGWYAVLGERALRDIYQHIIATGAKDCLELGTAFGATACVMAAAVEENGGGTVTTIDLMAREPIGVAQLAQMTGLDSLRPRHRTARPVTTGSCWVSCANRPRAASASPAMISASSMERICGNQMRSRLFS